MGIVCLCCGSVSLQEVLDLGCQPLANDLKLHPDDPEVHSSLKFLNCTQCGHYQNNCTYNDTDVFKDDYPYFSSTNKAYLEQCQELARIIERDFSPQTVLEIGCNDGYMLGGFSNRVRCFGVEPCSGPRLDAISKGFVVSPGFFPDSMMSDLQSKTFDVIIANNVLAHTPHLQTFISGLKKHLAPGGRIFIEVPNVENLLWQTQFDTIYHEHFSYFSPGVLNKCFAERGLTLTNIENIPSHGGSIRCTFQHSNPYTIMYVSPGPHHFRSESQNIRDLWVSRVMNWKDEGKRIAAYGAAAKGITFLNYCGLTKDHIDFCVDDTPQKQNKFMPGSQIPIVSEDYLKQQRPDILMILPWNFKAEIQEKTRYIAEWGGIHVSR